MQKVFRTGYNYLNKLIIFCHGLTYSAEVWRERFENIQRNGNEHVKFILPNALSQHNDYIGSVTQSWFNFNVLNETATVDNDQLNLSRNRIDSLIESEIANGLSSDRIMLGGHSQGGSTAMFTFYNSKHRLAGCIPFGAGIPTKIFANERDDYPNRQQPLKLLHGREDDLVLLSFAESLLECFQRKHANVDLTIFEDTYHDPTDSVLQVNKTNTILISKKINRIVALLGSYKFATNDFYENTSFLNKASKLNSIFHIVSEKTPLSRNQIHQITTTSNPNNCSPLSHFCYHICPSFIHPSPHQIRLILNCINI
ncbi:hypothetical protein PPL_11162 [Heterostelium album PN500]|uniref:Phospholipase/carboxylesterase/thioesterase domain-containing protein n=1 Tax=Heterostelium pallidum (strain ATCC 26659 / Pp 5 / PN500) TaxID=670386 RepID=D3BTQ2_HETP5|nr:hypothetical protein PPL_11162 [Heterostelium album PN500]EFA75088.1 hypothetical protein PPL_11162 [Heterostelium album PN500]|eukprot:XP_020427222.1 hypothetical protein PPL_11162 [Heterostelium album PN500]